MNNTMITHGTMKVNNLKVLYILMYQLAVVETYLLNCAAIEQGVWVKSNFKFRDN